MWETHKLDLRYASAGREEERKEEILQILKGLGELSEELGAAEPPRLPPWEPPR